MKKHIIKNTAALAVMGAILVAGNVSAAEVQDAYDMAEVSAAAAAVQNTYTFDKKDVDTSLGLLRYGLVGTGAHNATQEITERAAQYADPAMNCDVYFVHKNTKTDKYATVGVWIEADFGKCNSVYLSNSEVETGTRIRTESKTKKNPYSGATKASITGTVKY